MARLTWQNYPDTSTPLSAAHLNSLEERKPEIDELWVNIRTLGWQGTGDSVDLYVEEALDLLGANGGTIFFPPGEGTWSTLPSFQDSRDVILRGSGGLTAGAQPATRLTYTGAAARAIDARSSFGFQIRDLQFGYTNAAFTGILIDLSSSSVDPTYGLIERVYMGGFGVDGCSALISYNKAICQNVRDTHFGRAQVAVKGVNSGSDYSNIITFDNCAFVGQTTSSVINAGQAWTFRGCTFEPLLSGNASAFNQATGSSNGLTFDGCWFGDATSTGTWISSTGNGLNVRGCFIATGDKGVVLTASSFAADISGNVFAVITTGIDIAANCKRIKAWPNEFNTVTNKVVTADNANGSAIQNGDYVEHRGVPSVRAFSSIHQDFTTGSSNVLQWDSENWDSGTLHDNSTNPSRLTAPFAGVYLVTAIIVWNTGTTGTRQVTIRSGGATTEGSEIIDASGSSPQQVVTMQVKLAAAGYVEALVLHTQGVNLQVQGGSGQSSLSMTYLGTP